jgi:hypothetical protein
MQILWLKQHSKKQRLEGTQAGKVSGEAPAGNIPKGLQGIHGKGSHAELVVFRIFLGLFVISPNLLSSRLTFGEYSGRSHVGV